MYGYNLRVDEDGEFDDGDVLLDKMTGMSESKEWSERKRARDALGVTFELYSWGDGMPSCLAITESLEEVFDDGIMRVDALPPVDGRWRAMLDRVVAGAGLTVDGEPGWYFLARYW